MQVQPYLFFDGRCEEAIEFYKKAIGAKVEMLMHFKDAPQPGPDDQGCAGPMPPGDKVMHAALKIGDGMLMASDGNAAGRPEFKGFGLSLDARDDAEATRLFNALSEGGAVQQPLIETFFASRFGMVADKFGVVWMIVAAKR